jgi:octaprenyl-diphosphate synthase
MPLPDHPFLSLQSIENRLEIVNGNLLNSLSRSNQELRELLAELISRGGKRLRPALVLLAAGACGCREDNTKCYDFAVLVELIHTASLFHDDVIDNADKRRGNRSFNVLHGNHLAILAGDYLYSKAISFTIGESVAIQQAVNQTVLNMTEGEIIQSIRRFHLAGTKPEYLNIIEKKTAVLMSLACRLGALTAGTAEQVENLADYGKCLGMAFQIIDDLLDWVSEEEDLGKDIMQDFKEGRSTLPSILLMNRLPKSRRERFQRLMSERKFEENKLELLEYRDEMHKLGIPDELRTAAEEYSRQAIEMLESFPPTPELADLRSLPISLLKRNH